MEAIKDWEKIEIALKKPFSSNDINWRLRDGGIDKEGKPYAVCIPHVSTRALQERLDKTLGIGNWKDEYQLATVSDVILCVFCKLSLRLELKSGAEDWVTKMDGAESTDEALKTVVSSAIKTVGAKWRIGRYLYGLLKYFRPAQNRSEATVAKVEGTVGIASDALRGLISYAFKRAAAKWGMGLYLSNLGKCWAVFHEYGKETVLLGGNTYNWDPPPLPEWALPGGKGKPDIINHAVPLRAVEKK